MQGLANAAGDVLAHGAERLGWYGLGQVTGHGRDLTPLVGIALAALAVLVCARCLKGARKALRDRRVRSSLTGSRMVPAHEFLGNWSTGRSGHGKTGGYKALDQPGCYVIVTNPDASWEGYEAVYVGQSLHVCSRVRNHLTGHGNGDVYADVRNGERVFVRIVPCGQGRMNDLERELIDAFHATRHYNRTRGGATRR